MEFVEPIRDKKLLEEIKIILQKQNTRNYVLFCSGINMGLRVSDLLKLKVSDIKDRTHAEIKEDKTGKAKRFLINDDLKKYFDILIHNMPDDAYVFQSQKGNNQPLDRTQAYRIINDACRQVGIKDKIGTHTLRKTFGYFHYQKFRDVALLQNIFNHSSPSITLKYIGINSDIIDESLKDFSL